MVAAADLEFKGPDGSLELSLINGANYDRFGPK
jgi:hypothetical protein